MACIAKRRDKYVIDFYDNQGKRRWKTLPRGTTKAQAKDLLREIEDQLAKGVFIPDKKIPLFLNVAQDWLEAKKLNVRPSTWEMYRGHLEHHFKRVNEMPINRIITGTVEKFILKHQNNGMNITTLRKLIVTFNQVMQYAVRHRMIDHNPVRDAERPKKKADDREKTIQVLNPDEIKRLLDNVANLKYKTLFTVAIMTGARQGELLGLKWSDIDRKNNQIHIQRSYNKRTWYKPKTKTSERKIDVGPATMLSLKKWKLACPPNELDLIFPTEKGQPMGEAAMVRKFFKPALKKAGLPEIRFHDLRHTNCSIRIEGGQSIKYIQTQMGHSSPTVTLNVYAHLMKSVNQEAAVGFENMVFEKNGCKMVAGNEKGVTANVVTP